MYFSLKLKMKAMRLKSLSSQESGVKSSRISISLKDNSYSGKPTPKDFDNFIPWVCLELKTPRIVNVQRKSKDEYIPLGAKRLSSMKAKVKANIVKSEKSRPISSSDVDSLSTTDLQNAIPLTTYYNTKGHLVEISISNCPFNIHVKIIKAINVCLPFHPSLYKFGITKGGLSSLIIYEIGKLLPHSNITDVCLDDQYVPEGNFYVLFQNINQLQNLSLRRCSVNDDVFKKMMEKLDYGSPASKSLHILDLTSNEISDLGVTFLGDILRKNRALLHVSLSDNKISDDGAWQILKHLQPFPLNENEIYDLNHRQLKYYSANKKCEKEIITQMKDEENKENQTTSINIRTLTTASKISKKSKKFATSFVEKKPTVAELAQKISKDIIGEFRDIFDDQNTFTKNGQMYSIGNLKFCYLNLSYNDLGHLTVRKVYDVLEYQHGCHKPDNDKGLLRVVLDGNNIPTSCSKLDMIQSYLEKAVSRSLISRSEYSYSTSSLRYGRKVQLTN